MSGGFVIILDLMVLFGIFWYLCKDVGVGKVFDVGYGWFFEFVVSLGGGGFEL